MTKRNRTILFFICLILFILIAPTIVLYSQGFRFDFDTKKITQTGGLFLKIEPKQSEIYIDGKLEKKTDFLFGSALIKNLLPKKYKVEVKKEGYFSWEKSLEIYEKKVTEAKNIILFPQNPDFKTLTKTVENFWFSPDGKKIVLKEKENPPAGGWALKLYDLDKNVKSRLIGEKEIYSKGADLIDLEWSPDQRELYLKIGLKEQEKDYSLRIDRTPAVLTERKIPTVPENIITYQKAGNDVYYLDSSGFVFRSDFSFSPIEKINQNAFPVQQETEYRLAVFPKSIFIQEGQISYQYNPESKSFEKFSDSTNNLKISPDLKKIAYFSDFEIWILFLEDILEQPPKKASEKLFLTRFSEKISDVFWLNSNYLIFNTGNKIKIAEIDDRNKIQIWEIGELNNPEIFWNQTDKKLYILSEGNLFVSEKLIP